MGTPASPDGPPILNPNVKRKRFIHQVVTICEQIFWETGTMPTPERLVELETSPLKTRKQAQELYESEDFIELCHNKGLPRPTPLRSVREALTTEQMVAINVMLNPMDQRSERAKLDTVNELFKAEGYKPISMFKWNTWRRQPAFQQFLQLRANEIFASADYKWYQALEQQVSNGDVSAMKLFAQAKGINLDPERVQVQIDITTAVSAIFEILAEFVSPNIMTQIGERLDEYLRRDVSSAIEISERAT